MKHCGKYPPDPRCMFRQMGMAAVSVVRHAAQTGQLLCSKEEQERRLAICYDCPHYDGSKGRCKKCGCHMNIKTRLAANKLCPIGKW